MKHIVLDRNGIFTRITDKDELEPGSLYQVSDYHEQDEGCVFTRVEKITADIELPPEIKPGDLLRVVPHGKKILALEKVESGKTGSVLLHLPMGLYKTWLARATLFDNSIEQEILDMLQEVMQGWSEVLAGDEFETILQGKADKRGKGKAKA